MVKGFSKRTKSEKIDWILEHYFDNDDSARKVLLQYWNSDSELQQLHDEFIENTISNYYLPYAVAPNFSINGKSYTIPMVIEESSVVAAASKAAKFWLKRGGFKAEVLSTTKVGHVHFTFNGDANSLHTFFSTLKPKLFEDSSPITKNMEARGGGIHDIVLKDKTDLLDNYYQLHCTFETLDAMGANFINSCLEQFAKTLKRECHSWLDGNLEVIMCILSNYVPNCLVRASVECPVEKLSENAEVSGLTFAEKFIQAVKIAEVEPYRAVTHNKGIMNGIDAVILATGNDFRAVEAGVHAFASKDGTYKSLTHAKIDNGIFKFWIEIPLALGTVGGLTKLHPLVRFSLQLLGKPNAQDLMKIVAVAGLAQNFAALKSLTTTGIQQGHMKMHLMNILNQVNADTEEKSKLVKYFEDKPISHSAVSEAIEELRLAKKD